MLTAQIGNSGILSQHFFHVMPQTKLLRVGEVGGKNVKLQENQFGFQRISVAPSEKPDINSARWQNKQCLLF